MKNRSDTINSMITLVEIMANPSMDEKDKIQAADRFCELVREVARSETLEIFEEAA